MKMQAPDSYFQCLRHSCQKAHYPVAKTFSVNPHSFNAQTMPFAWYYLVPVWIWTILSRCFMRMPEVIIGRRSTCENKFEYDWKWFKILIETFFLKNMFRILLAIIFLKWCFKFFAQFIILTCQLTLLYSLF